MFPVNRWPQESRCKIPKAAAPKCHPPHKLKPRKSVPTLSKAHFKLLLGGKKLLSVFKLALRTLLQIVFRSQKNLA